MHTSISQCDVFSLKHQAVRDLAWSLWGSPLFIHPAPHGQQSCHFPLDWSWLKSLDQSPLELDNYLERQNTRLLGTYFEALWTFYFSFHPNFEQSHFNLQIQDDNRTLGELDILTRDTQGKIYHIELACKFYMTWTDQYHKQLWLGPNCSDRLDIKYNKTCSHQLPILHTPLGQQSFQTKYPGFNIQEVQQIAIWRGLLFQEQQWFHDNRLAQVPQHQNPSLRWIIADKRLWLSPVIIKDPSKLLEFSQIEKQIHHHFQQNKPYCLMLIGLSFQPSNNQWQQVQQVLITPNNWPQGKLSDSALTPLRPCNPPL